MLLCNENTSALFITMMSLPGGPKQNSCWGLGEGVAKRLKWIETDAVTSCDTWHLSHGVMTVQTSVLWKQ